MADDEKEGFTFVDKRGTAEASPKSPKATTEADSASENPTTDSTQQQEATSEARDAGALHDAGATNLPKLDVRDRLLMCIDIMNQGAWISLGLLSDPATGQIDQNLGQAQLAIDTVAFLAERVENELDDETRRDLRTLVRDLRLNYVQQKNG